MEDVKNQGCGRAQVGIAGLQRDKVGKNQAKKNQGVVSNWPPTSEASGGPSVMRKVCLKNLAGEAPARSVGFGLMSPCLWQGRGDGFSSQQLLNASHM